MGKTTNEVFSSKAGSANRTSTYLLSKEDENGEPVEVNDQILRSSSVLDVMTVKDYNQRSCSCIMRCGDFTCKRQMPD